MGDGLVERRLRLLVRHLQEQQERQLLDVVAVGQAVVPQDVAVVPELLDELLGAVMIGLQRALRSRQAQKGNSSLPAVTLAKVGAFGRVVEERSWIAFAAKSVVGDYFCRL